LTNSKSSKEKEYIAQVFLRDFLGLEFCIKWTEVENYELVLPNNKRITIEDHFFKKNSGGKEYLKKVNIPEKILWAENDFIVEKNIPIIFGNEKLQITEKEIVCGIDIFSSSFFMLTRWEESVNKTRDKHNRFPAFASLAFKNNFLHRPVVNEYVEMIWNMLKVLEPSLKSKKRNSQLILTHDVDFPFKYNSWSDGLREIAGDLIKRKSLRLAAKNTATKIGVHLGKRSDPLDTFDFLMTQSERMNLKSHFFFMGSGASRYDNKYDIKSPKIKKLANKIRSRGHLIGFHPSYNTYNNKTQFEKEKLQVETGLGQKVKFGRQHYLRFEAPFSWRIWEKNNMEWDSTLSYADKEGFRCGVCYDFSVFDFLQRKQLKLRELPLIVMEGSFFTYQKGLSLDAVIIKIKELMATVRRYNGSFVLLWHNSALKEEKDNFFYQKILNCWS
jgi:hypothetical protein